MIVTCSKYIRKNKKADSFCVMKKLWTLSLIFTILFTNLKAQSPGGVAGSAFWVKANAGIASSPIATWTDQSGSGNNATQGTAANRPVLVNNTVNFNSAVDFSGTSSTIMNITTPPADLNSTIFAVGVPIVNTTWRTMFRGAADHHPLLIESGSDRLGFYDNNANTFIASGFNWAQNEVALVGVEMQSGNVNFRKNGSQGSSITTINLSGFNLDYFGNYQGGSQQFGKITEAIIYTTTLTATNKNKIESYLAVKYGITLSTDYDATDGTVIWNSTTNAIYQNDIGGIGRDDNTALDQRKSWSINNKPAVIMDKGGAFGTDKSFLIWGSNNSALSFTTTSPPGGYASILLRTWRTQVTGTPGNVSVRFVLSHGIFQTGNAGDYALVKKNSDNNFSSGASVITGGTLSADTLTFTGISFTNGDYFSLAMDIVPQSPGGVSGMLFWVKGNAGIAATPIATWFDQSGTGNNATQGTVSNQPALVNNALNFNPVVDFTGNASTIMNITTPPADLNSTIFAVGLPIVNTTWRTMFRGAVNDHPLIIESGSDRLGYYDGDNGGFQNSGFTWSQSEPAVVAVEMRSGNVNFRKNGSQGSSITTINLSGINLDYFGNYQGSTQNFGKVAEAIVYNTPSALVSTDKGKIESYLAIKYGISLSTDYLASDGTLTWNSTTNATYQHDIAGIARDDNSIFSQQKSVSVNTNAVIYMDKGGAFASDKSFLIWGSDNSSLSFTTTSPPPGYASRLVRTWRTQLTGTPGAVSVRFILSQGVYQTGNAGDYALVIKNSDNNFSSGATIITGGTLSADTLTFTGVSFTNGDYFSLAMDVIPSSPGGAAGLQFWLEANTGIAATPVASWNDQSSNGNNFTQATASLRPVITQNSMNYNPAVTFDGVDDNLGATINVPESNYTGFVVFKSSTSAGVISAVVDPVSPTAGSHDRQFGFPSSGKFGNRLWNDQTITSAASYNTNIPFIGSIDVSGSGQNLYMNGTIDGSGTKTSSDFNWQTGMVIGGHTYWGYYNGDVSEYLLYSNNLTSTDRNKVESYLALKYGITKANNYVATDNTTVWDITANATYSHDIAGIGRDDLSSLNQKQSRSVDVDDIIVMALATVATSNSANTNSFGADKSYEIWGNDDGVANNNGSNDLPATIQSRITRVWKVSETGTVGTIRIRVDMNTVPGPTGNGTNDLQYVRLLVDGDGIFASGATIVSPTTYNNGTQFIDFDYDFTAGTGFYFSIGSTNYTNSPLPIELLDFSVDYENNFVKINWSTATETNNDYFEVQRSANASEFENIYKVKGAGNSSRTLNYNAIDTNPYLGTSYYRLQQTDFDGTSNYSKVVAVNIVPESKLNLYPNPADQEFILEGKNVETSEITLISDLGQKVNINKTVKSGKITFDASSLPKGIYFLLINNHNDIESRKVVIE